MNRICNICNLEIDEKNYLKDRTNCKSCYNKNRRKNNNKTFIQNQQTKIDKNNNNNDNNPNVSTYENHAYVVIGPRNVGKIYYMLNILERIGNQSPVHIRTRSPHQYPNFKKSTEIKAINKYEGSVVIVDDMIGARNCSQIGQFFPRRRHEKVDVYFISQSCFGLPRQSIRNNSDRLILFKQTIKDVQNMYYDIGAYDKNYDEFKIMCHEAWDERHNCLCVDMAKTKNEGKYRNFNESKVTYVECIHESEPL